MFRWAAKRKFFNSRLQFETVLVTNHSMFVKYAMRNHTINTWNIKCADLPTTHNGITLYLKFQETNNNDIKFLILTLRGLKIMMTYSYNVSTLDFMYMWKMVKDWKP